MPQAFLTPILLDGNSNPTIKNEFANESKDSLTNSWLGRRSLVKTIDTDIIDYKNIDSDIQELRQLLDEQNTTTSSEGVV